MAKPDGSRLIFEDGSFVDVKPIDQAPAVDSSLMQALKSVQPGQLFRLSTNDGTRTIELRVSRIIDHAVPDGSQR